MRRHAARHSEGGRPMTPRTRAGQALLDELAGKVPIVPGPTFAAWLNAQIVAIEQESTFTDDEITMLLAAVAVAQGEGEWPDEAADLDALRTAERKLSALMHDMDDARAASGRIGSPHTLVEAVRVINATLPADIDDVLRHMTPDQLSAVLVELLNEAVSAAHFEDYEQVKRVVERAAFISAALMREEM